MKISYNWLRELVPVTDSARALADRLSLSGLEVAAVEEAVPALDQVVVGEITELAAHPDADKLKVCQVNVGQGEPLQIVCGAPNARQGMKAPVILVGGKLPDGTKIRKAKLRGVASAGMICSARELGMSEDHSGLLDLPADAPVGMAFADYLGGADQSIEIEITPNRGDCLSQLGVARDVSALYDLDIALPETKPASPAIDDTVPVELKAPEGCPAFLGQVIRGIDPKAETPLWMRERLRKGGIRPISPVVDVTQYVMLELGQPMHGYDLKAIDQGIVVRFARAGEKAVLLDGTEVTLDDDVLVIADHKRILGLAGIMGGQDSGVEAGTVDVFLECAWFNPATINGRSRRLGLHTDAGYRFERGVDPAGQRRALERASALILEIAGGKPGPITETLEAKAMPRRERIVLRGDRLKRVLGIDVPKHEVERILTRLGMPPKTVKEGWQVTAPSHRFDIEIEEDLIEEVGRIYGFDHIPAEQYPTTLPMSPVPEAELPTARLREALVQRGYQEVITYSFVDGVSQQALTGTAGIELANPITNDMTHMRASLWPGLIQALSYNLNRQQSRVRMFEIGLRFIPQANEINQENVISGLVSGNAYPVQWGLPERPVELADLMGDLEALAALSGAGRLRAVAETHPALHPGQSARLYLGEQPIGWAGRLHPSLIKDLDVPQTALVFELEVAPLREHEVPKYHEISRYPAIRRDLALVVDEAVAAGDLLAGVKKAAGPALQDLRIFDIYRGKGVEAGRKSIALTLILQESSRTLTDEDADRITSDVARYVGDAFQATLRE